MPPLLPERQTRSCPATDRAAVAVVVATRNRRDSLLRTLDHLARLPERPELIVVDNGSKDGTAAAVAASAPAVRVIALPDNRGAVARNVGVAATDAAYVAFADDDSWWTPGSLARATAVLDAHPAVGGVVARVELHPSGEVDRVSRKHAADLLATGAALPGPRVVSFPAFAAMLRPDALQEVGGFSPLLHFGGEEQLLAIDLAMAGWELCYLDDVGVRHAPAAARQSPARWAQQTRNDVLVRWMRRSLMGAAASTMRLAVLSVGNPAAATAGRGVLRRLPAALRMRHRVPVALERDLRAAERPYRP